MPNFGLRVQTWRRIEVGARRGTLNRSPQYQEHDKKRLDLGEAYVVHRDVVTYI